MSRTQHTRRRSREGRARRTWRTACVGPRHPPHGDVPARMPATGPGDIGTILAKVNDVHPFTIGYLRLVGCSASIDVLIDILSPDRYQPGGRRMTRTSASSASTSAGGGRRSASMKDVAARAGVSVKTVSNVINGAPVGAATRERVQQAIVELGYRPNIAARNLRRGRTGILALAVSEVDVPYFAELARLIVDTAEEHGYTILIDQTGGDPKREQYVIDGMGTRLVDGIVFSPVAMDRLDIARRNDTTPLVLLGERVSAGPADHVAIDNVAAARTATEHLIGLGRRRVAAIGAQPSSTQGTAQQRESGYRL